MRLIVLLVVSVGLLFVPTLAGYLRGRSSGSPRTSDVGTAAIDGLTLGLLPLLIGLHLLPHALASIGGWGLLLFGLGVVLPGLHHNHGHPGPHGDSALPSPGSTSSAADRSSAGRNMGWGNALGDRLVMPSLLLHAASDGATLAVVSRAEVLGGPSAWAIVGPLLLHRVSEGLFLSALFVPLHGHFGTFIRLGLVASSTVIGAVLGANLLAHVPEVFVDGALALGLGVIAHMLVHPVMSSIGAGRPGARIRWVSGVGFVTGVLIALFLTDIHGVLASAQPLELSAVESLGPLFVETAPSALLGLLAASVWRAFQATATPIVTRRSRPHHQRIWTTLLLVPTASGVDGMFVSWRLLGARATLLRVAVGALVAVIVLPASRQPEGTTDSTPGSVKSTSRLRAFGIALLESAAASGPWLLLGLVLAAGVEAALGSNLVARVPPAYVHPIVALSALAVHVCAPGATALGAVLIHKGLPPAATIGMLAAALGIYVTLTTTRPRFGVRSILVIVATALLGVAANRLIPSEAVPDFHALVGHHHGPVEWMTSGVLGLWLVAGMLWLGPRAWLSRLWRHDH